MNFYKLSINRIKEETLDTKSIFFDIPHGIKEVFKYVSGQYLTIKLQINGQEFRRAYSIPNSPNETEIGITVKRVDKGTVSNHVNDSLAIGDVVEVATPLGVFVYQSPNKNQTIDYILVAAGSGITPIVSILKTILENESDSSIILIYGNKTENTVIYFEELKQLQENYSNRLNIHFIFSQIEKNHTQYLTGRINQELLNLLIKTSKADTENCFICGPEGLINTVSKFWNDTGRNKQQIFYEKFSSTIPDINKKINNGKNTSLTVLLDDEEHKLTLESGQTILDSMLAKEIDAPYSCGIGNCSSCIAKVLNGKAAMYKCETLDEGEVEEGYILTCQAHALSDNLIVSFDY
jgi:ring-1,2-phenylacetyl-CoA epoxidase subunit PaaE